MVGVLLSTYCDRVAEDVGGQIDLRPNEGLTILQKGCREFGCVPGADG